MVFSIRYIIHSISQIGGKYSDIIKNMSIFEKDFFNSGMITDHDLKYNLINCLVSDTTIIVSYEVDNYNTSIPQLEVSIKEYMDYFLETFGLPIITNDFYKLSLNELIEIYLTFLNWKDSMLNSYMKQLGELDGSLYGTYSLKNPIFKKYTNIVNHYLKSKNIKVIKDKNFYIYLSFEENNILTLIKNNEFKRIISKFIVLKENYEEDSLLTKESIISDFKNKLDFYMNNKKENDIKNNEFLCFNNTNMRIYWQSLFSHRGKKTNNDKWEKIKNQYESKSLKDKHILCNNIFDAIVFLLYKLDT